MSDSCTGYGKGKPKLTMKVDNKRVIVTQDIEYVPFL